VRIRGELLLSDDDAKIVQQVQNASPFLIASTSCRRSSNTFGPLDITALPPEWTKLAVEDLAGKPVESLVWNSPEGIPIKPLYTADDTKPLEVQQIPGEFARRTVAQP